MCHAVFFHYPLGKERRTPFGTPFECGGLCALPPLEHALAGARMHVAKPFRVLTCTARVTLRVGKPMSGILLRHEGIYIVVMRNDYLSDALGELEHFSADATSGVMFEEDTLSGLVLKAIAKQCKQERRDLVLYNSAHTCNARSLAARYAFKPAFSDSPVIHSPEMKMTGKILGVLS